MNTELYKYSHTLYYTHRPVSSILWPCHILTQYTFCQQKSSLTKKPQLPTKSCLTKKSHKMVSDTQTLWGPPKLHAQKQRPVDESTLHKCSLSTFTVDGVGDCQVRWALDWALGSGKQFSVPILLLFFPPAFMSFVMHVFVPLLMLCCCCDIRTGCFIPRGADLAGQ